MKLYFAAPLFAASDLRYNAELVASIRQQYPQLEIYLPQENDRFGRYRKSTGK